MDPLIVPRRPAAPVDHAELSRRQSRADQVELLFRARPGQWISAADELATVGGALAWRTRVSDVRRRFEADGLGTIEWNHNVSASAYRWVRVTRPAAAPAPASAPAASQRTLF